MKNNVLLRNILTKFIITFAVLTPFTGHSASMGSMAGAGGPGSMLGTTTGASVTTAVRRPIPAIYERAKDIDGYGDDARGILKICGLSVSALAGQEDARIKLGEFKSSRFFMSDSSENPSFYYAKMSSTSGIPISIISISQFEKKPWNASMSPIRGNGFDDILPKFESPAMVQSDILGTYRDSLETLRELIARDSNVIIIGLGVSGPLAALTQLLALKSGVKSAAVLSLNGVQAFSKNLADFFNNGSKIRSIYINPAKGEFFSKRLSLAVFPFGTQIYIDPTGCEIEDTDSPALKYKKICFKRPALICPRL